MNDSVLKRMSGVIVGAAIALGGLFIAPDTQAGIATLPSPTRVLSISVRDGELHDGPSWFMIDATSLGTCPAFRGNIIIALDDDEDGRRQLSLVTSALLAGSDVDVVVDDRVRTPSGSFCRALAVTLK